MTKRDGCHTPEALAVLQPSIYDRCTLLPSPLQVWKRYSRFLDLRSELSDKVPPVKDLPFPKKKLQKKKDSVRALAAALY
jgi:hypothetical protein